MATTKAPDGSRICGVCGVSGFHWDKTADGFKLKDKDGVLHRCAGGTVLAPASIPEPLPDVHPAWIPDSPGAHVCTFVGCGHSTTPITLSAWQHKDGPSHRAPWTACDKHVPRVSSTEAPIEDSLTDLEPEPATELPELGGTFLGPQKAELVDSLQLGHHCMLVGPTATGKSLCATEAFPIAGDRPVLVIEGHESLRESDLLGSTIPTEGHFAWVDGVLTQAMREGAFLFVDEANRMPMRTLNVLLGVLSRGAVRLTEHGSEEVVKADGFQVVMAMNLGKAYAVNGLDRALMDRFSTVLHFDYLDAKHEAKLLSDRTGIDATLAAKMVKVANETRKLRRERQLSAEISPRGLFAWAEKYKAHKVASAFPSASVAALVHAAEVTWMHAIAGTDADGYLHEENAGTLRSLIEAHCA